MLHADYEFNESLSAGLGFILARPVGAFARLAWVPFNAHGRLRPIIALECRPGSLSLVLRIVTSLLVEHRPMEE